MMMMMMIRSTAASSATPHRKQLTRLLYSHHFMLLRFVSHSVLHKPSLCNGMMSKVFEREPFVGQRPHGIKNCDLGGILWIHSGRVLSSADKDVEKNESLLNAAAADDDDDDDDGSGEVKKKRKKLKGKRAVVRWLRFFRWKKKKEYQRMTAEEKILFKLKKARRKEERLVESLRKIEPKETSETTHDPEILTPEEHFYFLKMGQKCKNYVPVGRRGIYQGVILNMHLHWKKHQTLKVIVKTFSPEEVKELAVELARLTGGIVLNIEDDDTIIMYRGKNYSQPPTEIMSPRTTLPRKKALDKSKYRDALRAVRRHIPKLEQDLELLQAQVESKAGPSADNQSTIAETVDSLSPSVSQFEGSDRLKEILAKSNELNGDEDSMTESGMNSESDSLTDIFETDSDSADEDKVERHLYLDELDKIPPQRSLESQNFEEHLRQISADSRRRKSSVNSGNVRDLDEVDKVIIQAASLLKKKRR